MIHQLTVMLMLLWKNLLEKNYKGQRKEYFQVDRTHLLHLLMIQKKGTKIIIIIIIIFNQVHIKTID